MHGEIADSHEISSAVFGANIGIALFLVSVPFADLLEAEVIRIQLLS